MTTQRLLYIMSANYMREKNSVSKFGTGPVPQQPVPTPPIHPLPVTVQLAQTPDNKYIVIVAHTPQGVNHIFLEADQAEHIGKGMVDLATAARTGLTLPGMN